MGGKLMYLQIEQEIRRRILSGEYPPNSKMPTENELGEEFGVSRLTVSKGMGNLVLDGLITRTRGKGSFVTPMEPAKQNPGSTSPGIFKFISPPSAQGDDSIASNQLLEGITDAVRGLGYSVSIDFFSTPQEELELLREYRHPLNDGFVIWPTPHRAIHDQLREMHKARFPFIQLDHFFQDLHDSFLMTDSIAGARMVVRHLYGLGHRRIAYLSVPLNRVSLEERFAGTLSALCMLRLKTDDYLGILPGSDDVKQEELCGQQTDFIRGWLERVMNLPQPPTAIFCSNDTLSITILNLLKESGVSVPEDVSVAGFDNAHVSSWLPVPLTSVSHDFHQLGYLAGKILIQLRHAGASLPFQYRIAPKLCIRQSTGPASLR